MTNNKKETKKEFFLGIMAKYPLTDYEKERFEHEIELLDKKNSTERKPTKNQLENENLTTAIYDFLCDHPETAYTVTELNKACPALAKIDASTSKTTQLLKPLKTAGKIKNFTEKRKSYYQIAD
jgi:hypothetical protein